jgi:hypothetical protein
VCVRAGLLRASYIYILSIYWIMNGHGMKITIVKEIGKMLHL